MKKTQLIIGVLLMILGIGLSVGSAVLHHYEQGARHRIASGQGFRGGYGFRGPNQRGFNRNPNQNIAPRQRQNPTPTPNQVPGQNPNQNPNQSPNQGQGGNGGVNQ